MSEYSEEYRRTHAVKVCREECIEEGLMGEALRACIDECVKKVVRKASH